jgi:superkiller protein 3
MKDLAGAQREFEALVRSEPANTDARVELGQVYAESGAFARAAEEFETVLEVAPRSLVPLMYLGRVYLEMREFDKAESALQDAVALEPGNVFIHVNLGRLYHELGRCPEAVREFRWVVRERPDNANAYFMLGEALTAEGRSIPEAIAAFKRGLELNPQYVEGHISLGDLFVRTGAHAEALHEFEVALRLRPADSGLHAYLRARILDLKKRLQK